MNQLTFCRRSLSYHRRSGVAVVLAVAAGATTLIGALLVGDSVRQSLRDLALRRLGPVSYAMTGGRFFGESLGDRMHEHPDFTGRFSTVCPAIVIRGAMTDGQDAARVNQVDVFGIDDRFGRLFDDMPKLNLASASRRNVILNQPLADSLHVKAGDDVVLRLSKLAAVPTETLLGRRDDTTISLRLTVASIIPADGLGEFSLTPTQRPPRNAYVPLATLQEAMKLKGRVNAILVDEGLVSTAWSDRTVLLQSMLAHSMTLGDYGLKIEPNSQRHYLSLQSDRLLLEPPVEEAALAAAAAVHAPAVPMLTYLANRIAVEAAPDGIPYSTVTAIRLDDLPATGWLLLDGARAARLGPRDILLNEWAASDLHAKVGDRIRMEYYVARPFGRLDTVATTFTLRGIVPLAGPADDPGFTPTYEGITNAKRLSDWNPPFPLDLKKIREKDEEYWNTHKTTPKAFISLNAGQELWAASHERFGRLTSIRLVATPGKDLAATAAAFEKELLSRLNPAAAGLAFQPIRAQALAAAGGNTDFGMLFIGFSSFLILSAAMLVSLMFRLGVERRAREIGLLLSTGFSPRKIARLLLVEGALLAAVGLALGLAASRAYTWLMLAGLRSWWAEAVHAPFLQLHTSVSSAIIGVAISFFIALISIAWSIRGLTLLPPRSLLAGNIQPDRLAGSPRRRSVARIILFISTLIAAGMIALSFVGPALNQAAAFFAAGAALLIAALSGLSLWMQRDHPRPITAPGPSALLRLGVRNAARHHGRSLLTAGLVASASFVIVAVAANQRSTGADDLGCYGGAGGFSLYAESTVPLPYSINTHSGRIALNLQSATEAMFTNAFVSSFRLQGGDDASCLNLYQARQPRILGATNVMIERGGFRFAQTMPGSPAEKANPWTLLNHHFLDGAIPAIGDENTVRWLLHLGLGDDLRITDERGHSAPLRIVATLSGSILQGELIVAEDRFVNLFPSSDGQRVFLIDAPRNAPKLAEALQRDLSAFGLDVQPTAERLAAYHAVENTYLSTFQTLGGLGFLLGTIGLASVLLRNVNERRSELALMRALGFRPAALGWIVWTETAVLLATGLAAGSGSALLAVAPAVLAAPSQIPWASLLLTLLAAGAVGLSAGAAALTTALRTPLMPALRAE